MEALLFFVAVFVGMIILGMLFDHRGLLLGGLLWLLYLFRMVVLGPVIIAVSIWAMAKFGVYAWIDSYIHVSKSPFADFLIPFLCFFSGVSVYLIFASTMDAVMERLGKKYGFKW